MNHIWTGEQQAPGLMKTLSLWEKTNIGGMAVAAVQKNSKSGRNS